LYAKRKKSFFNSMQSEFFKKIRSRGSTLNQRNHALSIVNLETRCLLAWIHGKRTVRLPKDLYRRSALIDNSNHSRPMELTIRLKKQNRLEDVVFAGNAMDNWLIGHGLDKRKTFGREKHVLTCQNARWFCARDKTGVSFRILASSCIRVIRTWREKFKSSGNIRSKGKL